MEWKFIVALILAIPVLAFPMFFWYLDIGGSYAATVNTGKRRASRMEERFTAVARQRRPAGTGENT